ncbi:hypothetical protein EUX98_g4086 [Antrodiella citrinella]|uniref:Uncharacterized protein n=1 Tax=Antrodiella citrinella TaxID=2447956 RepID=A0A4S4MW03_9APHY|nr:hypothetical protein EUX98_g4086 [Antrodiella citrinella]
MLSSAGATFVYTPTSSPRPPTQIVVKVPDTSANNWSLHASSLWTSSISLADHIDDVHIPELLQLEVASVQVPERSGHPLRVLELGAGAGIPAIYVAALYGAEVQVTASDYPDPGLIRTLEENVKRNNVGNNCKVVPYAWGTDPTCLLRSFTPNALARDQDRFDLVLAADTLWNADSHRPFLETLTATLRRTTHARVHLVAGLHTGRYTLRSFMDLLPSHGLDIDSLGEWNGDGRTSREWYLHRGDEGEDERERRRWVLWMSLKWGAEQRQE